MLIAKGGSGNGGGGGSAGAGGTGMGTPNSSGDTNAVSNPSGSNTMNKGSGMSKKKMTKKSDNYEFLETQLEMCKVVEPKYSSLMPNHTPTLKYS